MKTGNAIVITAALVLVVFVGIVVAEDFMMPQEVEEDETVISINDSDNVSDAANVKRHVPPRGVMQKFVLVFWDPFGRAPVDNWGLKLYNGALWYQYPDHTWIQVAFINENKQVTHIQTWNQNIVNVIQNNYQTADNVTVTMVEQPPEYDAKQPGTTDNTDLNNSMDEEKINTTINLKDQTLANDTNSTITGTLVDENGTAIADAEVSITVNGQSTTQTTDSNGQFTYEYNTESSDLSIGSNTMQVSYSGNETYNGASKTVTVTLEAIEEVEDTEEPTESDSYADTSSSYNYERTDNSMDSYSSDDSYSSGDSYSSDDYYTIELLKVFS